MKASLPDDIDFPILLHIVSHTPGRIRLRLAHQYRKPEVMTKIAITLQSLVPEIEQTRINPQMGSLTIAYDPANRHLEDIWVTLHEMNIIAHDIPVDKVPITNTVTHTVSLLNQQVNQLTEGSADLRFLAPLLLIGLALRQLLAKGDPRFKAVPWYALVWYAFDTFMKLNPSSDLPQPQPIVEQSSSKAIASKS
ncbi:MAG: hypothetical protein MUF49_13415 [Oculatellaceae cyanobacterium Prado106]|jgi:hypothetical protein|nr:hypothetical protein [Oculatellaceae cyanobacterium Prado106]